MQRAAVLKGEAGIGPKPKLKDSTFETAKTEFLKWSEANKKPRTHRGYRNFLTRLAGSFAGSRLSEIDPLSVERHKHARIKAGARIAANRELAVLKAMFNRCRALGLYERATPEIRLTKEPKTRIRFLSDDEEVRLLAAAGEPLRTIVLVGIHTGLRTPRPHRRGGLCEERPHAEGPAERRGEIGAGQDPRARGRPVCLRQGQREALHDDPEGLRGRVRRGEAHRHHAAHPTAHVRLEARDGRRRSADDPGIRRLVV